MVADGVQKPSPENIPVVCATSQTIERFSQALGVVPTASALFLLPNHSKVFSRDV